MSSYHIISGQKNGEEYDVVFHISVPDEMNMAKTCQLCNAVKEDRKMVKHSSVPWIDESELNMLKEGKIIEYVETYRPKQNLSLDENKAHLDKRYRDLVDIVGKYIRDRYAYWRYNRDV